VSLLVVVALSGLGAAVANASKAAGPRLVVNQFNPYPNLGSELKTIGPLGEEGVRIAGGSIGGIEPIGRRPTWSPDGKLLAFEGSAGEHNPLFYVVNADGTGLRPLRASRKPLIEGDPVFTPDGRSLAFARLKVISGQIERPAGSARREAPLRVRFAIWKISIDGDGLRPLTPWRKGVELVPSSFSPDGSVLGATEYSARGLNAVAVHLGSGRTEVLGRGGEEPVYSPTGSGVAYVKTVTAKSRGHGDLGRIARSSLFEIPAGGGTPTKLAGSRGGIAWPSWDPSGRRLSFTLLGSSSLSALLPRRGNPVMEVNSDGSCLTKLLSAGRGSILGTAWQPGPGREAGPIAC
jgi:Tol biopolymer transport system component